jgi:ATP/maltotriose-dependent transcriptional regulator MalT
MGREAEILRILQRVERKLDSLLVFVSEEQQREERQAMALEEIRAEVERNRQVDESAKALIEGIAAKLAEMSTRPTVDPAEVAALAAELRGSSDTLAAAVTANTPSA